MYEVEQMGEQMMALNTPTGEHLLRNQGEAGFTYLALLMILSLLSLATNSVMTHIAQAAVREREDALLRFGEAYVDAIASYYQATPGRVKQWPKEISDLLEDKRHVSIKRHLRESYPDPVARNVAWTLVRAPDGGILGVQSTSSATPIRTTAIQLSNVLLMPAQRYSDWLFVYTPPAESPGGRK